MTDHSALEIVRLEATNDEHARPRCASFHFGIITGSAIQM